MDLLKCAPNETIPLQPTRPLLSSFLRAPRHSEACDLLRALKYSFSFEPQLVRVRVDHLQRRAAAAAAQDLLEVEEELGSLEVVEELGIQAEVGEGIEVYQQVQQIQP